MAEVDASPPAPPRLPGGAGRAALELSRHSMWTGVAFVAIILVAIALEFFSRALVHFNLIEADGFLFWLVRIAEGALALADVVLLVAVFVKLGWRFWKEI